MIVTFITGYVGSKKYWIDPLDIYKGKSFIELFAGSAVLSANLASSAILNDIDPYVYKILSRFDELIVPDVFTQEDYYKVRSDPDWWKYSFCLQKMSFSGVFRYSKNGYNVPAKPIKEVRLKSEYEAALTRWKNLHAVVLNNTYTNFLPQNMSGKVVIADPPYDGSQASYNKNFDYSIYWDYIKESTKYAGAVIIFDRESNLTKHGISQICQRNMRVNGKYAGDIESLAIYQNGKWCSAVPNEVDL